MTFMAFWMARRWSPGRSSRWREGEAMAFDQCRCQRWRRSWRHPRDVCIWNFSQSGKEGWSVDGDDFWGSRCLDFLLLAASGWIFVSNTRPKHYLSLSLKFVGGNARRLRNVVTKFFSDRADRSQVQLPRSGTALSSLQSYPELEEGMEGGMEGPHDFHDRTAKSTSSSGPVCEVFEDRQYIEYFSETHQKWIQGSIQGSGHLPTASSDEKIMPTYHVRLSRNQWRRFVPVNSLRLPFQPGDSVSVNVDDQWQAATVQKRHGYPLAYEVQLLHTFETHVPWLLNCTVCGCWYLSVSGLNCSNLLKFNSCLCWHRVSNKGIVRWTSTQPLRQGGYHLSFRRSDEGLGAMLCGKCIRVNLATNYGRRLDASRNWWSIANSSLFDSAFHKDGRFFELNATCIVSDSACLD